MSDRLDLRAALTRARGERLADEFIIEIMEELLSVITDIQAQLDTYEQGVGQVFGAINTALTDLAAKVTALEAAVAAAGINPDEVAAVNADIAAAQALIPPELASVQAADPGPEPTPDPPAPDPAPAG